MSRVSAASKVKQRFIGCSLMFGCVAMLIVWALRITAYHRRA